MISKTASRMHFRVRNTVFSLCSVIDLKGEEKLRLTEEKAGKSTERFVGDFNAVKDRVTLHLVNSRIHEEMLRDVLHRTLIADIAVVYCVDVEELSDSKQLTSVIISRSTAQKWGKSEPELFALACSNTSRIQPAVFERVADVIDRDPSSSSDLYVLSNGKRIYGAAAVLYPSVLESIHRKYGGSFYILPSSVHEVLTIPVDGYDPLSLAIMVADVNNSIVELNQILSYNVLKYDGTDLADCGSVFDVERNDRMSN